MKTKLDKTESDEPFEIFKNARSSTVGQDKWFSTIKKRFDHATGD